MIREDTTVSIYRYFVWMDRLFHVVICDWIKYGVSGVDLGSGRYDYRDYMLYPQPHCINLNVHEMIVYDVILKRLFLIIVMC